MEKKTVYLQVNYKIEGIPLKEVFKARVNSDGSYSIKYEDNVLNFYSSSDAITILEEGNTTQEEINDYFSDPLGKKFVIKQGIEEDKKKYTYHLSLNALKDVLLRYKNDGRFFDVDWNCYVISLEFFDKKFGKMRSYGIANPDDPFFDDETHAVSSILTDIITCVNESNLGDFLDEVEDFVSTFKEKKEKRLFTQNMLISIASYCFDSSYIDLESDLDTFSFACEVANTLYEKYGNFSALNTIAMNHYTGTPFEKPNYEAAKRELEMLLESGSPYAANTLGYLTLYHGGQEAIDYDKALKYFSIGAMFNIPESKMKVADLLSNPECSSYNPKIAARIYINMFRTAYSAFASGDEKDTKYADLLLRMYFVDTDPKYGQEWNDEEEGVASLLTASLAIKKRINEHPNYIGDTSVATRIASLLEELPREEEIKDTYSLKTHNDCFFTIGQLATSPFEEDLVIRNTKENDGYVTIEIGPLDVSECSPKIFSLIRMKRAFMSDRLTLTFKTNSSFFLKRKEMKIEDISLEPIEGADSFSLQLKYENGEKTFLVKDPKIILPKEVVNEKEIRLVSANFSNSKKTYDYICDDNVSIDDVVYVPSRDGMKEATVNAIKEMYVSELALPITYYKKASKDFYYYS